MPVPFEEFRPIFPPHPAAKCRPEELSSVTGYLAQLKYDDWRTLIYVFPDGNIRFFSRKMSEFSNYRPPVDMIRALHSFGFAKGKFQVLDGGLLHYKTERVKDTLVLWDLLVHDGIYLLGTGFIERYRRLEGLTGHPSVEIRLPGPAGDQTAVGLQISRHLWLAPVYSSGFEDLFRRVTRLPEIEGLVLKSPTAPLRRAVRAEANARWMIRVRKPEVHYRF